MSDCRCRSGLPEGACHDAVNSATYQNRDGTVRVPADHWPATVRDSSARASRRVGYQSNVRGNALRIYEVNLPALVRLDPVAGPEGWLQDGRRRLSERANWITREIESDPGGPRLREYAERSVTAAEALEGVAVDLVKLQEFLIRLEEATFTNDAAILTRAVDCFLREFPGGGVDLVSQPIRTFELWNYVEALAATSVVNPEAYVEQTRGHDRRYQLDVSAVLEALLERNGPRSREGFFVKRPDSSLLFSFGSRLDPPRLGVDGLVRPRGMNFGSLRPPSSDVRVSRVGFGMAYRRQYIVKAAEQIQQLFFHALDPLRFVTPDEGHLDIGRWTGLLRTLERIVGLTYLIQTTPDLDTRRELFLGLLDLYEGLGIAGSDPLPRDKWFRSGRAWLPEPIRDAENKKVSDTRAAAIQEIWDGVMLGRDGETVSLPGQAQPLSPERYAQRYLRASRNALTHGYQTTQQRDALMSVMLVHSGRFPQQLPQLAVPMLEALLGHAPKWIAGFRR